MLSGHIKQPHGLFRIAAPKSMGTILQFQLRIVGSQILTGAQYPRLYIAIRTVQFGAPL